MRRFLLPALGAAGALGLAAYAMLPLGAEPAPDAPDLSQGVAMVAVTVPGDFSALAQRGRDGFNAVCAECHGENAAGRDGFGPPLVHRIYEPSHHGDLAFQLAAAQGVRAHHWPFGDMPPQPDVTRGDVVAITAYIRDLQRANGIE
ncbi:c-type cytochrome [Pararhodobacter marinus]|uniref:c-type cytochrome n=1 Tax=Pararhodobacter marinus TaxID=2184063 RepID=UPI003519AC2B